MDIQTILNPIREAPIRIGGKAPDDPQTKAVKNAISAFEASLWPNPMNDREVCFGFKLDDGKDGVCTVEVYPSHGTIHLSWIQAHPQGTGAGTHMLNKLKKVATQYGVPISLSPDESRGQGERLDAYYRKQGFIDDNEGSLIWTPETSE